MMKKTKVFFSCFFKMKHLNKDKSPFSLIKYAFYRMKYKTTVEEYYGQKLYYFSFTNHKKYIENTNTFKRSWRSAIKSCAPKKSKTWLNMHFLDYCFSRLFYPGLDATDYFHYEFYNFSHEKRKTFITEGNLKKIDYKFNKNGDEKKLSDKAVFNELFSPFIGRKWIKTLDIDKKDLINFCSEFSKIIVKPLNGLQGKGIFVVDLKEESALINLYQEVHDKEYIIEELIKQHDSLEEINPASVNSVRVYSVVSGEKVNIMSAALRMGNGQKPTDNYSSGGMAAAVDIETGMVISPAINKEGIRYYIHPYTGTQILGFNIPCWKEIVETVKQAHGQIPELRYVAWDIAVTNESKITLIEGNTCGGVNLQQHPLLSGKKQQYEALL